MKGNSPNWAAPELGRERLTEAAAAWLATFAPWTTWLTLTFRNDPVEGELIAAVRSWVRAVARSIAHHHVPYAAGWDATQHHPHAHVLLALPKHSRNVVAQVERQWRQTSRHAGLVRSGRYVSGRGAERYLVAHPQWYFGVGCDRRPRCRRSACIVATGRDGDQFRRFHRAPMSPGSREEAEAAVSRRRSLRAQV